MTTIPSNLNIEMIKLPRTIKRALKLELAKRDLPQNYGNAAAITGDDIREYADIGPRKAVWWDTFRMENPAGQRWAAYDAAERHFNRLELSSLLYAYETEVLAIYDLQREDLSPFDFEGIDRDLSIAKHKAALARIRETILACAEPT
jgi:hypothetical protein